MRTFLFVLCGGLSLQATVAAQGPPGRSEPAVAAIRKLGGEVKADATRPGAPLTVVLTGASRPAACLPYLKDVGNLDRCDL